MPWVSAFHCSSSRSQPQTSVGPTFLSSVLCLIQPVSFDLSRPQYVRFHGSSGCFYVIPPPSPHTTLVVASVLRVSYHGLSYLLMCMLSHCGLFPLAISLTYTCHVSISFVLPETLQPTRGTTPHGRVTKWHPRCNHLEPSCVSEMVFLLAKAKRFEHRQLLFAAT